MRLSFVRFGSSIDAVLLQILRGGWDWSLGDASSLDEFVSQVKESGGVGYWVFRDGVPVGVLEFNVYSETFDGAFLDLGLFIHKDYRGDGVAEVLFHSAYVLCRKLNFPLIATVHEDNSRSLGLVRKASGFEGVYVYEANRGRYAWVFDLSVLKINASKASYNLVGTMLSDVLLIEKLLKRV